MAGSGFGLTANRYYITFHIVLRLAISQSRAATGDTGRDLLLFACSAWRSVALTLVLAGALAEAGAAEPPRVMASIKPVHAIVAGVMEGVAAPGLVIRGGGSPHTYVMRPSDARRLNEADLVFWIGESLEAFLRKPLLALGRKAKVVTLLDLGGLARLPLRTGGIWRENPADAELGDVDTHVWLDPTNARAIADAAAVALGEIDPPRRGIYAANARRLTTRLAALDAELRSMLAPVAQTPYAVFHDAYQHFERRYGLNNVGAVAVSPDRPPGARRLKEIRGGIAETRARCFFSEPQFEPALVHTVIEGTGVRAAVLDPLGADLKAGPEAYFALMRRLARSLRDCLAADG